MLSAFGDAAAVILQSFTRPRLPRLVAIVAYYPSSIPESTISYPASIRVIVHLADDEIDVKHHPEVLGIRSNKTKTIRKRVDSGTGYGGRLQLGFRSYTYNDCESGFAEHDLDDYNAMAEDLAFSRSLAVIKQAFHLDNDIELIRDTTVDAAIHDDVEEVLDNLSEDCVLINAPVLTGGNGVPALRQYYAEMFSGLPPSFTAKLISRTIGSDRIVDEVLLDFDHTQPIPWLLPDVPASGRHVKIVLISITSIRGEKIVEEHTYWDQASLLLQIGLLDPRFVPETWKDKGITRLPVAGSESVRAVLRGGSKYLRSSVDR